MRLHAGFGLQRQPIADCVDFRRLGRDLRISPTAIVFMSKNWHVSGGVILSQLVGDAEDSPVVAARDDSVQWMAGLRLVYAW